LTTLPIGAGAKIEPIGGFIGVAIHLKEVTGLQVNFLVPLPDVCPSLEQMAPFFGVAADATFVEDKINEVTESTEIATALMGFIGIPFLRTRIVFSAISGDFLEIHAVKIGYIRTKLVMRSLLVDALLL
jgi:hypothetical protein